jgi:hypothetical protein
VLPLGKGQATERVSCEVLGAFNVKKGGAILFNEETPPRNSLCLKSSKCEVAMVCTYVDITTAKQHCTTLLEGFDDGENFLFSGRVAVRSSVYEEKTQLVFLPVEYRNPFDNHEHHLLWSG